MASPQTEDGYTRIANELLEALTRTRVPGQELRIVLFIARKTYGYGKKQDQISYGQIAKATNIPRTRVIEHVRHLVSKMILGSLNNGTRQPLTIWINKDYEKWQHSPIKGTSPNSETRGSPIYGNRDSPNNGTHKRKKERKKERKSVEGVENVKLTKDELSSLRNKFPSEQFEWMLQKLDAYIGSKGDKYKDHYALFRKGSWLIEEMEKRFKPGGIDDAFEEFQRRHEQDQ